MKYHKKNSIPPIQGTIPASVRVVMPVYNGARFIASAIESVLNQTIHDWELVIVDDGSTDNTMSIIRQYSDHRIFSLHQRNSGDEVARQRAFEGCQSEFVARLDADDTMLPTRLEDQIRFLRDNTEIGAVGGQIMYISEDGQKTGFRSYWGVDHNEILQNLLMLKGALCNPTLMVRRQIQEAVRPTIMGGPGADVGYALQLCALTKVANLPDVVNYMRIHGQSIQSSYNHHRRLMREQYSVMEGRSLLFNEELPDWSTFICSWDKRGIIQRIKDWHHIVLGSCARRSMWHVLNGSPFQGLLWMGLGSLLAPMRASKKAMDLIK